MTVRVVQEYEAAISEAQAAFDGVKQDAINNLIEFCKSGLRELKEKGYRGIFDIGSVDMGNLINRYGFEDGQVVKQPYTLTGRSYTPVRVDPKEVRFDRLIVTYGDPDPTTNTDHPLRKASREIQTALNHSRR